MNPANNAVNGWPTTALGTNLEESPARMEQTLTISRQQQQQRPSDNNKDKDDRMLLCSSFQSLSSSSSSSPPSPLVSPKRRKRFMSVATAAAAAAGTLLPSTTTPFLEQRGTTTTNRHGQQLVVFSSVHFCPHSTIHPNHNNSNSKSNTTTSGSAMDVDGLDDEDTPLTTATTAHRPPPTVTTSSCSSSSSTSSSTSRILSAAPLDLIDTPELLWYRHEEIQSFRHDARELCHQLKKIALIQQQQHRDSVQQQQPADQGIVPEATVVEPLVLAVFPKNTGITATADADITIADAALDTPQPINSMIAATPTTQSTGSRMMDRCEPRGTPHWNGGTAKNCRRKSTHKKRESHRQHQPEEDGMVLETTTTTAGAQESSSDNDRNSTLDHPHRSSSSTPTPPPRKRSVLTPMMAVNDLTRGLERRACPERHRRTVLGRHMILQNQHSIPMNQLAKLAQRCTQWATTLAIQEAIRDANRAVCHDDDNDDDDDDIEMGDSNHSALKNDDGTGTDLPPSKVVVCDPHKSSSVVDAPKTNVGAIAMQPFVTTAEPRLFGPPQHPAVAWSNDCRTTSNTTVSSSGSIIQSLPLQSYCSVSTTSINNHNIITTNSNTTTNNGAVYRTKRSHPAPSMDNYFFSGHRN